MTSISEPNKPKIFVFLALAIGTFLHLLRLEGRLTRPLQLVLHNYVAGFPVTNVVPLSIVDQHVDTPLQQRGDVWGGVLVPIGVLDTLVDVLVTAAPHLLLVAKFLGHVGVVQ